MNNDTMIYLCETPEAARRAADSTGVLPGLRKLFVMLGDTPAPGALEWVQLPDIAFTIERARELSDGGIGVGVRAGLMYAGGWSLFFCHASAPPSAGEVARLQKILSTTDSACIGDNVWGVTREHLVLYGFDDAFGGPTAPRSDPNASVSLPELAQAMAGRPVALHVALAALLDILPTDRIDRDTSFLSCPAASAWQKLHEGREFLHGQPTMAILMGTNPAKESIGHAMERLAPRGLLVVPIDTPTEWENDLPIFRRIRVQGGPTFLVIGPKPVPITP